MRYLLLLVLTACGEMPYLTEGIYEITLVETDNSCGWPNGDTGRMSWAITNVEEYYGITHMTNGETMSCTQNEDGDISCSKSIEAYVRDCRYDVSEAVVMKPDKDNFVGTFQIDFVSCNNEMCGQKAAIKGYWYTDLPLR